MKNKPRPKEPKNTTRFKNLGWQWAQLNYTVTCASYVDINILVFCSKTFGRIVLKPDSIRGKTKPAVLSSHSGSLLLAANGTQTQRNVQENNRFKRHKSISELEHWMLGKSFQETVLCWQSEGHSRTHSWVCCSEVTCVWFCLPSHWGVCPELISSLFLLAPSKHSSKNMMS